MSKITTLRQAVASNSYFPTRMNRSSQLGKRTSLPFAFTMALTLLLSLVRVGDVWGQVTVTISSGTSTSIAGTNGDPIYRSSTTSSFHHSKSIQLVTSTQLNSAGVVNGSTINSWGYNKRTNGRPNGSNAWTFRVYLKNVTNTSLASGSSWNSWISGATLAYSATINSSNMPATAGYWLWPTTGFTYTGQSVVCCIEWFPAGTMATPFTTNSFRWQYGTTSGVQAIGRSASASIPGTNSLWTTQTRFYNTQLTYTPPPPCTGTPAPGNTLSSSATVALGGTVNLSLQNATAGSGVTYQWQSSTTSSTSGFSNITGATSSTYTATINAATWYRCIVTCSGNSGTSNSVQVTLTYCTPSSTNSGEFINVFTTSGGVTNISNSNSGMGTSPLGYQNFTSQSCSQYQSMAINFTANIPAYAHGLKIWVDWNNDFDFLDAGEAVYTSASEIGGSATAFHTGSFNVPSGQVIGSYRMRVRSMDWSASGNLTSCNSIGYGECEDYTLQVITCPAPTAQASAINFSSIGPGSASVNWTNGNGAGRVVYINSANSFTPPTNGTNPTASTTWSNTGQQCIFNGTGSGPVSVTGLSASTQYFVRVYEYCSPNSNYQTATATSNPNSFTTAAPSPTLTVTGAPTFSSQCVNTTSNQSSFTVSGVYLTNNVSVGSLAGYTYSTTSNGTYTSTLT